MDCSPPGSSVHGILQARILEWVAMPSSRGSSRPRGWTWVSGVSFNVGRFFTEYSLQNILRIYLIFFTEFKELKNILKKKPNPNLFYICLFQVRIWSRYTRYKCEAEWCTRNSQRRRRWGGGGFGFGGFTLGGRGWRFRRGSGVNQEDERQSQGETGFEQEEANASAPGILKVGSPASSIEHHLETSHKWKF